jgi:cysteinyl-tRNA synthetase
LRQLGYQVTHVMNLTDVGHLTGDNEGDANQGEDRLEKAAKKEGKSAWEISRAYASEFLEHMRLLNIQNPAVICRATDHIAEQIAMVQELETKGFTYRIADGIYFDVAKYESMGHTYGALSTLDQIKLGARLEPNPEKRDPRDFALWKFSPSTGSGQARRQMEWDSPWGVGFPGWHIECSAMSTKYLGPQFDIHVGGEDLRSTHHPNEIAQAEGASGKEPFVTTWVHGAFLLVDGGRMGKSLGNAYTVADIVAHGFEPLALRYFYLTGHYRRQLNFTWEALKAAQTALTKLRRIYQAAASEGERTVLTPEKQRQYDDYLAEFRARLEDDLDMPGAIATTWEAAKSNIPGQDKADLLRAFDEVLGLQLNSNSEFRIQNEVEIPTEVAELVQKREELRAAKEWAAADQVRDQLLSLGWTVRDEAGRSVVVKL